MHDVLLILPVVGPPNLYTVPRGSLQGQDLKWYRRLTRVPQGLLSIGSWLEQHGFSVKLFDSRLHLLRGPQGLEDDLRTEIRETRLFVGISVLTMHIAQALEISRVVKEENPNLLVVWGGVHPTLFPEQTAADPLVDFVVQGVGEAPLLGLANIFGDN